MPSTEIRRALLAALLITCACAAQEPRHVPAEEAARHVIRRVEPRYPSLAEMAHIQGEVTVRLVVDENGKVTDTKGVKGHPMLLEAAIPAVKEWKFEPFLDNGKAIPVSTMVTVMFALGPGAERRREYLQQEVECTRLMQLNKYAEAEAPCRKALATALQLPKSFESDKMRAYGNAGTVAYGLKKPQEALDSFKQQVNFAEQALQPGSPQMVQVRGNLAHAYVAVGQLDQADSAYGETEKAQEAAQADLENRRDKLKFEAYRIVKTSYDHNMQVILQEHVAVLRKLGRGPEAQALEQKASSLAENK